MSEVDSKLEEMLKTFLNQDKNRKENPAFGTRAAENTLMDICEYMKAQGAAISDDVRKSTVAALQKMNLVPYRSYLREHLLDIGVTNV